ncbi:MAG: epoxyqueuosine reductase QueH [Clostridia bacterium]|nr:epoxyqueuosine reductase QueH [Clostridia bacterium]
MQALMEGLKREGKRPRLLLHSCCAPCSTAVLTRLCESFDITVFFYNPNIDTRDEHDLRAKELETFVNDSGLALDTVIIPWEPKLFYERVRGLEGEKEGGKRCEVCFGLRLDRTARYAAEHGYDLFTTTLTISPMKSAPLLNRIGEEAAKRAGAVFLNSDFKKRGGYLLSTQLSREYGIYRQDYCGCVFSKRERAIQNERAEQ